VNSLEDAGHDRARERRWAFRKPSNEFVEELFCGNLEVKWISAHLDEGIEQSESEERDVRIAMVYGLNDEHRGLSRAVRDSISCDIPTYQEKGMYVLAFFLLMNSAISMWRA
jgi:hypothetical protein